MALLRNVVFLATIAGFFAGVAMAAMQSFATVPLILEAETYESAAQGVHQHAHATTPETPASGSVTAETWSPAAGFERFAYTAGANVVGAIGFALLLVAVSEALGGIAGWRQGLLWGFAGFAVFTLAPGLGLPPELPGMPAADLVARQVWWVGTVLATAAGIALLVRGRTVAFASLGVALLIAPHIIGAPQPVDHESAVPVDLHHRYVVAATLTNLVFWLVIGGVAGAMRARFLGTGEPKLTRGLA